jgi:glycyl-tRNA synthetase beta chain
MTDFLLELRCEEVPARMQAGARRDLEKLFREQMQAAAVTLEEITVWSTPRRLALIAKGLPDATAAVSEELKGPKLGAPPQALEGFLRKTGLTQDQLTERDGVYFAVSEKPGRATRDVLAEAIPAIIRAFPWPKSQRWGAASISTESLRWVRPLSGIVAIFGQDLVECAVGDVRSGFATKGHRFHAPGEITIGGASDYQDKLRACHVIVDHAEREALIRTKASAAATAAGLVLVEDEGLVIENAGLTEWPVPLLGRFDAEYLEVPPEVIQLTARTNQKYFVCEHDGKLANAFVCTANIEAADGGAQIVSGNRKVLAARLSDARFFWQQDRKMTLAQHAESLARITFHEKLGTVADKVERVAKLARWLVEQGIVKPSPLQRRGLGEGAVAYAQRQDDSPHPNPSPEEEGLSRAALADLAELAARLCKADLVTEMVGEFPELQGLMGGYYARAKGLDDAVADAIRDHYKPVGQGDDVPSAPVTVAVSLADKLDTIAGFFMKGMKPTGSKDPFALRRAALGILALTVGNGLRGDVADWLADARQQFKAQNIDDERAEPAPAETLGGEIEQQWARIFMHDIRDFILDRLKVQQREAGVRHDLIDAVFALGGEDDLVRLLARVHALQAFVGSPDGTNLLSGYKRAANILKKEQFESGEFALSYTPEPAEKALIVALDSAEPQAAAAVAREDFSEAMAALASLRAPIDLFFDSVTVNDADQTKRQSRLALLERFRDAVHSVADFSKIEG